MNRFVSLVSKSKQHFLIARLNNLSTITSKRCLASSASNNHNSHISTTTSSNKSEVTNPEWEKPQWERSDRYKIFYGFSDNEAEDKGMAHYFTFVGLFGLIFLPTFVLYFFPDHKATDWCHREAYLELSRREKAGGPLINPDYVPIDKIKLPSEEELGDTEIVI